MVQCHGFSVKPRCLSSRNFVCEIHSKDENEVVESVFLNLFPKQGRCKEVIQPQIPLRLPCYDFPPLTEPRFEQIKGTWPHLDSAWLE